MRFFCSTKKCQENDTEKRACNEKGCEKGCIPLSEVKVGDCACIRRYNGCGKMRKRLLAMGLTPQAKVDVIRKAPLGDPIVLKIGDFDLTLSESEAVHVEVALVD